jgi:hypothetical protein
LKHHRTIQRKKAPRGAGSLQFPESYWFRSKTAPAIISVQPANMTIGQWFRGR